MQIHWEFIAKSLFRRREGSAGRRRVGGAEIGWFGGCQNPCHFLINSVSESGHFGPPEGPRHISGVFGPAQPRPARRVPRAPPRGRRAERRSRARAIAPKAIARQAPQGRRVTTSSSVRFPFCVQRSEYFFLCPEVGLEYSISTSGRSRRTRSRRRSSQSSGVNRRRSILHIRSWTHSKTCAPPQPQREREFRTILNRPLDTSKLKF